MGSNPTRPTSVTHSYRTVDEHNMRCPKKFYRKVYIMRTITKQNKVINYLSKRGRTLTAGEARARFGVRNLRATMSDIREIVEEFGNWRIETRTSPTGLTQYAMRDTHPGRRQYGFRKDGSRFKIR